MTCIFRSNRQINKQTTHLPTNIHMSIFWIYTERPCWPVCAMFCVRTLGVNNFFDFAFFMAHFSILINTLFDIFILHMILPFFYLFMDTWVIFLISICQSNECDCYSMTCIFRSKRQTNKQANRTQLPTNIIHVSIFWIYTERPCWPVCAMFCIYILCVNNFLDLAFL